MKWSEWPRQLWLLVVVNVVLFVALISVLLGGDDAQQAAPVQSLELPPAGVERLRLINESELRERLRQADFRLLTEDSDGERASTDQPQAARCLESEALAASVAARLAERLRQAGAQAVSRDDVTDTQVVGHWVFLPPARSEAAARDSIQQLERAGIQDYYLVRNESSRLAISLGLFSSEDNARRRLQAMREAGFDARLERREEEFAAQRVKFRWQAGSALPTVSGVEIQERACES